MNTPRNPLRFNVGFLLRQPVGFNRDFHFDFPQVSLGGDLTLVNFTGVARVAHAQQGIQVQCEFQGHTQTTCVRCLKDFDQSLRTAFSESFAFSQRSEPDSELTLPENGDLDLEPLTREYLLLEIPISPLCKPDCRGLCKECGEDLNLNACPHHPGPGGP